MRDGISFTVAGADCERLTDIVSYPLSSQQHVWRARIDLLSDDGLGHLRSWRRRAVKDQRMALAGALMHGGIDGLLSDQSRLPGKAPIPPKRVAEIVRLTQEPPPHEATHWTAHDGQGRWPYCFNSAVDLEGTRPCSVSLAQLQAVK